MASLLAVKSIKTGVECAVSLTELTVMIVNGGALARIHHEEVDIDRQRTI